jgi:hypothetical protein
METVYKNSHYLFISVLIMAFAGFWNSYFSKFPTFEGITTPMQFHGLMCLLWLGILITQPILIRQNKLDWHRKIGKLSYIVVPLLILSMAILTRLAFIRNSPPVPGKPDVGLIGFADMIFFLFSYGMAIYYRKKTSYHARYMVLSVLPFINPSLGRLELPGPILALIIMVGLLIYERFNNKVYRPYALSLPIYFVVYVLFIFVITVPEWKAFWWMFF